MNFYKRFVGDYQRDTGHLSLTEHGAYTLLLDIHYATEKPLPSSKQSVYRLLRAIDESEQTAIDRILDEFWTQTDNGWVNPKALELIDDKQKRSEKAKELADKRWENTEKASDSDASGDAKASDSDASGDAMPRHPILRPGMLRHPKGIEQRIRPGKSLAFRCIDFIGKRGRKCAQVCQGIEKRIQNRCQGIEKCYQTAC